jgi:hypothetical protein
VTFSIGMGTWTSTVAEVLPFWSMAKLVEVKVWCSAMLLRTMLREGRGTERVVGRCQRQQRPVICGIRSEFLVQRNYRLELQSL